MKKSHLLTPTFACRGCAQPFPARSQLVFENMPSRAQQLPEVGQPDETVAFSLLQCPFCGLLQLDCEPPPYYREVIRAAAVSAEMTNFRKRQFRSFFRRHDLCGRKVFECGCGGGEYLSIMQSCGVQAYGWEFGAVNVDRCRQQGLKVEQGFFATGEERLQNGPFDAFVCLNVLEHMPDLLAFLTGLRENLTVSGRGLLEVPNFDMMLRQATVAEFMRDHLCYFTRESLCNLLERQGFVVRKTRELFHGYFLSLEVQRRQATDLSCFDRSRTRLIGQFRDLVARHGASRTVIWGASHQALALLAMAALPEPLLAIIDSSPLKQGRCSPGTKVPVVAPNQIKAAEISLLIAAAGGYSQEVAKLAREKFGPGLEIHLLLPDGLAPKTDQDN